METLLSDYIQSVITDAAISAIYLQEAFTIVKNTEAEFGIDGDQFYYKTKGDLAESTCIAAFGSSPYNALMRFRMEFLKYSVPNKFRNVQVSDTTKMSKE